MCQESMVSHVTSHTSMSCVVSNTWPLSHCRKLSIKSSSSASSVLFHGVCSALFLDSFSPFWIFLVIAHLCPSPLKVWFFSFDALVVVRIRELGCPPFQSRPIAPSWAVHLNQSRRLSEALCLCESLGRDGSSVVLFLFAMLSVSIFCATCDEPEISQVQAQYVGSLLPWRRPMFHCDISGSMFIASSKLVLSPSTGFGFQSFPLYASRSPPPRLVWLTLSHNYIFLGTCDLNGQVLLRGYSPQSASDSMDWREAVLAQRETEQHEWLCGPAPLNMQTYFDEADFAFAFSQKINFAFSLNIHLCPALRLSFSLLFLSLSIQQDASCNTLKGGTETVPLSMASIGRVEPSPDIPNAAVRGTRLSIRLTLASLPSSRQQPPHARAQRQSGPPLWDEPPSTQFGLRRKPRSSRTHSAAAAAVAAVKASSKRCSSSCEAALVNFTPLDCSGASGSREARVRDDSSTNLLRVSAVARVHVGPEKKTAFRCWSLFPPIWVTVSSINHRGHDPELDRQPNLRPDFCLALLFHRREHGPSLDPEIALGRVHQSAHCKDK